MCELGSFQILKTNQQVLSGQKFPDMPDILNLKKSTLSNIWLKLQYFFKNQTAKKTPCRRLVLVIVLAHHSVVIICVEVIILYIEIVPNILKCRLISCERHILALHIYIYHNNQSQSSRQLILTVICVGTILKSCS